jgi:putative ABC transport system ATP-binding protein
VSDTAAAAVNLESVTMTYGSGRSSVDALRGIDLELPAGELTVVLGPSGSGKTTLLNVIGAMESPTGGRVLVGGEDLTDLDEPELTRFRRDRIGFVFQFFNLVPTLTALENVMLIAELADVGQEACEDALRSVGLEDRMGHFPGALSGGEQQRVAIARAVVKRPELVLCDEPTGALDLETGRTVLRVLADLNRRDGRSVLMVTHNAAIAEMADRVVRMRSGEIEEIAEQDRPVEPEAVSW